MFLVKLSSLSEVRYRMANLSVPRSGAGTEMFPPIFVVHHGRVPLGSVTLGVEDFSSATFFGSV